MKLYISRLIKHWCSNTVNRLRCNTLSNSQFCSSVLFWEHRQTLVPFSPTGLTHCCFHCLPRYKDSSSSKTASCSTMQRARREALRPTGTSTSTPRWAAASSLKIYGVVFIGWLRAHEHVGGFRWITVCLLLWTEGFYLNHPDTTI